jgi:hypothetical protein
MVILNSPLNRNHQIGHLVILNRLLQSQNLLSPLPLHHDSPAVVGSYNHLVLISSVHPTTLETRFINLTKLLLVDYLKDLKSTVQLEGLSRLTVDIKFLLDDIYAVRL